MSAFEQVLLQLNDRPKLWLVTGVAGFIGSHLLEILLRNNQRVIGLDNFSTGKKDNLRDVLEPLPTSQRARFRFIEGDIRNLETCQNACAGVDFVLHQAALGSVPRSMEDPISSHENNVTGSLNVFVAARDRKVQRVVYASSSAVYGDNPDLPKTENKTGQPLSPYAVTKAADELYANVFWRNYGLEVVGLRYFNVFGPRQDPRGAYAAVIPRWIMALMSGEIPFINGDGSVSRDFCYVSNVLQANILAATTDRTEAIGRSFNVALNRRATLLELFEKIRAELRPEFPELALARPCHRAVRAGDIPHSQADIEQAVALLGYAPTHTLEQGLKDTVNWFKNCAACALVA